MRPRLVVLILSATATLVVRCQEADLDELLGDEGSGLGNYVHNDVKISAEIKHSSSKKLQSLDHHWDVP